MSAREEVLGRVRAALEGQPPPGPVPRAYRTVGEHAPGSAPLLDLLEDRLVDYRASVQRCTADDVDTAVGEVLDRLAPPGPLVVPAGLPPGWTAGREVVRDDGRLGARELDETVGVVTGCAVAVAETGTIVLDGGPEQGRRALTLVPDLFVCVVRAEQVVQTVPEALRRLDPTRPQTWVSGPSATSDIELSRVEGVHGPRTLSVVLVTS